MVGFKTYHTIGVDAVLYQELPWLLLYVYCGYLEYHAYYTCTKSVTNANEVTAMKTIRVYEVDRGVCRKFGNYNTREEVLADIERFEVPLDVVLVYTVVDKEDPVASSMIMQFHRD